MGANQVIEWSDGVAGPLMNFCSGPAGSAPRPLALAVGLSEVTAPQRPYPGHLCWTVMEGGEGLGEEGEKPSL